MKWNVFINMKLWEYNVYVLVTCSEVWVSLRLTSCF